MGTYRNADVAFIAPLVAARVRAGGGRPLTESEVALCGSEAALLTYKAVSDGSILGPDEALALKQAVVVVAAARVEAHRGHPLTEAQIEQCLSETRAMRRVVVEQAGDEERPRERLDRLRQTVAAEVDRLNLGACLEDELPAGGERVKPRL